MMAASFQKSAVVNGYEKQRGILPTIFPLEGEMSPKMTEGGGNILAKCKFTVVHRHTPLCPAGHLPLKGGDRLAALCVPLDTPHIGGTV